MDAKKPAQSWQEPAEENPKTFEAIKAKLEENKVNFELTTHE